MIEFFEEDTVISTRNISLVVGVSDTNCVVSINSISFVAFAAVIRLLVDIILDFGAFARQIGLIEKVAIAID